MSLRGGGPPRRLVGRPGATGDDSYDDRVDAELDPSTNGAEADYADPYGDEVEPLPRRIVGNRGAARPSTGRGAPPRRIVDDGYAYDEPEYTAEFAGAGRGSREAKRRYSSRSGTGDVVRFLLLAAVLATVVIGALVFVARPVAARAIVNWGAENSTALSLPFVADIVRGELGPLLTKPAGTDASDVNFVVTQDETPHQIAAALREAGLLTSDDAERAFVFESIVSGAELRFQVGNHKLKQTMTPSQIIGALQQAPPAVQLLNVTFREGLRMEQMVALLEAREADPSSPLHALKLDPKAFYDIVSKPPSADLVKQYPFLSTNDKSLEGFLFPATYQLYPESTPDDLVNLLLTAFQKNAPPELLALPPDQIYKAVTLASLVETEAKVDSERPLIAGVYTNRLAGGPNFPTKLLQADPTVNWANDTIWLRSHPMATWVDYTFWNRIQGQYKDFNVPSDLAPYQTYKNTGLPPTPICSPGVASLSAAASPDTKSGYYYFVATGDSEGTHAFAKTYPEFQKLLQQYQYTP